MTQALRSPNPGTATRCRDSGHGSQAPPHALFTVRKLVTAEASPWSATERLVALVLAGYMNPEGRAWPSVARVAAAAGLGRRTVQRALARLTGPRGVFREVESGGSTPDGGRRASEYVLATRATVALVDRRHCGTGATDDADRRHCGAPSTHRSTTDNGTPPTPPAGAGRGAGSPGTLPLPLVGAVPRAKAGIPAIANAGIPALGREARVAAAAAYAAELGMHAYRAERRLIRDWINAGLTDAQLRERIEAGLHLRRPPL